MQTLIEEPTQSYDGDWRDRISELEACFFPGDMMISVNTLVLCYSTRCS